MSVIEKSMHRNAVEELYRVFLLLNEHFYNGELKETIITLNFNERPRRALNWCKAKDNMHHTNDISYELEIYSELFNLSALQISQEIMHEMVHLYNLQHGIKDCAPTKKSYHNENFKIEAIKHGLSIDQHTSKHGWSDTYLSESAKEFINSIGMNMDVLRLVRTSKKTEYPSDGVPKGNSYKYQCSECGTSVRATKVVNINCGDCNVKMERILPELKPPIERPNINKPLGTDGNR